MASKRLITVPPIDSHVAAPERRVVIGAENSEVENANLSEQSAIQQQHQRQHRKLRAILRRVRFMYDRVRSKILTAPLFLAAGQMSNQRIYLDNAATSWPKPDSVYDSVDQYQRNVGVPYGRGGYSDATTIGRTIDQLRVELAQFIDAAAAQQIVFTYSGTDSLNFAIQGTLRPGDHVVTTNAEHNSVLRPLRFLEQQTANAISVHARSFEQ